MNEKKEKKLSAYLPNAISCLRIISALGLLFTRPLSTPFFILYTLCGVTDVLDGTLARAMGCTSDVGAVLDSVSDLLFYAIMMVKVFPLLLERLSVVMWCIGIGVVVFRAATYLVAAWKFRRFAALHTYLNKITGFAVFSIPYLMLVTDADIACIPAAVFGFLGTLEELLMHLTSKQYTPGRKTIFSGKPL